MIPPEAQAIADVRVLRVADYDAIEKKVREQIKKQLVARGESRDELRAPPPTAGGDSGLTDALAKHAQQIYRELGKELVVDHMPEGGGTDAAFAALSTKAPVIERFGLARLRRPFRRMRNTFSSTSIEPRLYLLARMIMDISRATALSVSPERK